VGWVKLPHDKQNMSKLNYDNKEYLKRNLDIGLRYFKGQTTVPILSREYKVSESFVRSIISRLALQFILKATDSKEIIEFLETETKEL